MCHQGQLYKDKFSIMKCLWGHKCYTNWIQRNWTMKEQVLQELFNSVQGTSTKRIFNYLKYKKYTKKNKHNYRIPISYPFSKNLSTSAEGLFPPIISMCVSCGRFLTKCERTSSIWMASSRVGVTIRAPIWHEITKYTNIKALITAFITKLLQVLWPSLSKPSKVCYKFGRIT